MTMEDAPSTAEDAADGSSEAEAAKPGMDVEMAHLMGRPGVDADEEAASKLESPAAGTKGTPQILREIWPLAVVVAMFHVFMMLEVHIYIPYLYSRVTCCQATDIILESKYDVTDPAKVTAILLEARRLGLREPVVHGDAISACSLPRFSPSSPLWSMSTGCPNKAFVEDSAQHVMAVMKPLQKLTGVAVLPVGGAIADGIGRRPVLAAYGLCILVACLVSALDCKLYTVWGNGFVYLGGILLCVSFQPKDTIISGSVADVLGQDEPSKARAFTTLVTVNTLFTLVCNGLVYFLLRRHIASFFAVWGWFACLAGMVLLTVWLVVRETLPSGFRRKASLEMLDPFRTQLHALRLVAKDKVLICLTCVVFLFYVCLLGFFTIKTSYLVSLGFSLEETLLPEMLANVAQVLLGLTLVPLLPRLGVYRAGALGSLFFATGFALYGPGALLIGKVGPYIGGPFTATGILLLLPAFQTIISQRAEETDQGKCQAAVSSVGTTGGILGVLLYNRVLFSATAEGLAKAMPCIVSMVLMLAGAAIFLVIPRVAKAAPLVRAGEAQ